MKEYDTDPKLDKLVDSNDYKDRIEAAEQGYRLDKLINDENELVFDAAYDYLKEHYYRSIFDWAKDNSVDLDIDEWLNSDSWTKRYAVAKHGYRLDKLINDEDDYVHWAVEDYLKEHSYNTIFSWAKDNNIDIDLNDWLNSDSWCKRRQVAKQGYGLDKLVCDEDWQVHNAAYDYLKKHNYRSIFDWAKDNSIDLDIDEWLNSDNQCKRYAVARYGYRLDILINDENYGVRNAVYNYLEEHNYKTVFDWAKDNNVDLDLDDWLNSDNNDKRVQVARQGYRLDKLINDEKYDVRIAVAMQGYCLDKLINDENWVVRITVARQGYGLDKLVNDKDRDVRAAVAEQGYGLNKLINDKHYKVRYAVARQGYGLDTLVNDENRIVRKAVARQGYRLDKLAYDEDSDVREAVEDYLEEHNLTLDEWCIQNKKICSIIKNLKDFVYKVEDSSKIKVETSYDSIEAFFEDTSDESYENKESIVLMTIDTKVPLIKLEKTKNKDKNVFKFIADISNDDDDFRIRSIFETKEKFEQLLQSTINALRGYSQFNKYADELESCI